MILYQQWCVYAQLDCSFDAFKAQCIKPKYRSAKSILKEVDGYINLFNQGYKKVEI